MKGVAAPIGDADDRSARFVRQTLVTQRRKLREKAAIVAHLPTVDRNASDGFAVALHDGDRAVGTQGPNRHLGVLARKRIGDAACRQRTEDGCAGGRNLVGQRAT